MHLQEYLSRIAVVIDDFRPTLEVLSAIMVGHMNYIPFENLSIVLGEKIEFDDTKIFEKLVSEKRGGYCFEQNALLKSALDELGFVVEWLLCRVRWGKVPESFEAGSTFTHVALKVTIPSTNEVYLADVGFAGTNSVAPVEMTVGDTLQTLPEGVFRVTTSASGSYSQLENQDRDDPSIFRPLYKWCNSVNTNFADLEAANWFSCTFPKARFTSQFFCSKICDNERCYILNSQYVRRNMAGAVVHKETIDNERMLELVSTVFTISLSSTSGLLSKYL